MKTMVFWHKGKKPKDWAESQSLPMGFFECGRLEKGDTIELNMLLKGKEDEGTHKYTVKVAKVEISLSYRAWTADMELFTTQYVHVK